MGKVSFAGAIREVCLAYVPEARLGDYVIVHAGFALSVLDEEQARQTLDLIEAMTRAGADDAGADP
jgi:hydrogenase expression/formation protein HypC